MKIDKNEFDSRYLPLIQGITSKENTDYKDWIKIPGKVLIISSENTLKNKNAQFALTLLVNTIARTYPIVTEIGLHIPKRCKLNTEVPLFEGNTVVDSLINFFNKLQTDCKYEITSAINSDWDVILSIGQTLMDDPRIISISSDGWFVHIAPNISIPDFSNNINPIGAYVAACIGGIEVFKIIFNKKADIIIPEITEFDIRHRIRQINQRIAFSTFDYSINKIKAYNPRLPTHINIKELYVIGAGAGGGATLYTLASFPDLRGDITVVDPDEINLRNLYRYIYPLYEDAINSILKVEIVKSFFKDFKVKTYNTSYQKFIENQKPEKMDIVVSTVDSSEAKCQIQWDIPRVIFDAAVANTQFYFRRIDLGKSPCLLCTHKDRTAKRLSNDEQLSKIINIPANEIQKMRLNNLKFEVKHIKMMKESKKEIEFTLPKVGERFNDWFIYHCSELYIPQNPNIRFPLPYVTILPGILMAGEIIKERYFSQYSLNNTFIYEIVSIPNSINLFNFKPHNDCSFCTNEKIIERYNEKYKK